MYMSVLKAVISGTTNRWKSGLHYMLGKKSGALHNQSLWPSKSYLSRKSQVSSNFYLLGLWLVFLQLLF